MKKNLPEVKLIALLICFVFYSTPCDFLHAEQLTNLGQVIAKSNAVSVDSNPVPSGTTILSGDKIQATNGPAVLSLLNGGRIELAQGSTLSLQGNSESVTMTGLAGGARFYFPRDVSLTILTPKSVIRANASGAPLSGSVLVEENKATLTSERGQYSLEDKETSQTTTVKEGETATLPDQKDAAATAGTGAKTSSGGLFGVGSTAVGMVIAGAAAAAIAIPLGIAAADTGEDVVSPSRP